MPSHDPPPLHQGVQLNGYLVAAILGNVNGANIIISVRPIYGNVTITVIVTDVR